MKFAVVALTLVMSFLSVAHAQREDVLTNEIWVHPVHELKYELDIKHGRSFQVLSATLTFNIEKTIARMVEANEANPGRQVRSYGFTTMSDIPLIGDKKLIPADLGIGEALMGFYDDVKIPNEMVEDLKIMLEERTSTPITIAYQKRFEEADANEILSVKTRQAVKNVDLESVLEITEK